MYKNEFIKETKNLIQNCFLGQTCDRNLKRKIKNFDKNPLIGINIQFISCSFRFWFKLSFYFLKNKKIQKQQNLIKKYYSAYLRNLDVVKELRWENLNKTFRLILLPHCFAH